MNQIILKDPRKKLQKIEQQPEGYCVHARKLGAFVDDPIMMRKSVGLNAHIKKCPDCQETLKELREFYDLVERSIPKIQLENERRHQIMLELKELYKAPVFRSLAPKPAITWTDRWNFLSDVSRDLGDTLTSPPLVLTGTFVAIIIWTYKFFS